MIGIIPANIVPAYGVYSDYLPAGKVRTNMAHINIAYVAARPDAILSVDITTWRLDTGRVQQIESFDLKVVTLRRISDNAEQGVQMWVMVGNKDELGGFHPLTQANWSGRVQSFIYFDLNHDGQKDDESSSFIAIVPWGLGIPFAFHEFYDQPYIINTWYYQEDDRQFWAAWHDQPRPITNRDWAQDGDRTRMSTFLEESWWSVHEGGWGYGSGSMSQMPDGHLWPKGGNATLPGAFESRARFTSPMWLTGVWKPSIWSQYTLNIENN